MGDPSHQDLSVHVSPVTARMTDEIVTMVLRSAVRVVFTLVVRSVVMNLRVAVGGMVVVVVDRY